MHGRLKVRTTEEQRLIKQKEQQQKLLAYQGGMKYIHATRHETPYNKKSLAICSAILEKHPDVYTLWNFRKEVVEQEINKLDIQGNPNACLFDKNKQAFDGNVVFGLVNKLHLCFQSETHETLDEIKKKMKMNQVNAKEDISCVLVSLNEHKDDSLLQVAGLITWCLLYSWHNQGNVDSVKQLWKDLFVKLEGQKHHLDVDVHFGNIISIIRHFISEERGDTEILEIFKGEELEKLIQHLREILKWNVGHFLQKEIDLTERCLLANPKSYGAWHHRYWVLERHPQPKWEQELQLVEKYLRSDDRNFHTWDYRRLLLKRLERELDAELEFSTDRINTNFSNYSSWHYRSTLNCVTADTVVEELRLVQNAVFTDPYDSSTWFYLRWVLSNKAVTDSLREALLGEFDLLLMMEPTCRWIYLAKCWIKGNGRTNTKDVGNKLVELDPMRKGFYQDYFKLDE